MRIATCHTADAGEWFAGATPEHGLYALMRTIARNPRVALFAGPQNTAGRLARGLDQRRLANSKLSIACRLCLPDEEIHLALSPGRGGAARFQTALVLVERSAATGVPCFGLDDLEYIQRTPEKGLITKQEARAFARQLRLRTDAVVWDIGAGSGSVGLEAARPGTPVTSGPLAEECG